MSIRDFESRPYEDEQKVGRSWPVSAWIAVGTMIVLNLLLGAYIFRTELLGLKAEFLGHEPAEESATPEPGSPTPDISKSVSPKTDVPMIDPRTALKPLQTLNPLPSQSPKPDGGEPDATKDALAGNPNPDVQNRHIKASSRGAAATRTPKARDAKRAASTAARRRATPKHYLPQRYPRARFTTPQREQMDRTRTPAPVPAAIASPTPAPGTVRQPSMVASVRTPTVGTRNQTEAPRKVITPSVAEMAGRQTQPVLNSTPGVDERKVTRVASVGLPGMDKGVVVPKKAVGPLSPKMEIVRRPPEPKEDVPNCGGDVQIPCPTLHKRPSTGSPDDDQ